MSTLDIDDEGKEESDSHYDSLMARPEMARTGAVALPIPVVSHD